jgi:hypothetical protein
MERADAGGRLRIGTDHPNLSFWNHFAPILPQIGIVPPNFIIWTPDITVLLRTFFLALKKPRTVSSADNSAYSVNTLSFLFYCLTKWANHAHLSSACIDQTWR